MLNLFRFLLAFTLVHPLEGITFGDWFRLLRRERFRINPLYWPRALLITAQSLWNSLVKRWVARRKGAAIASTRVVAPVFILGHYRSGTTQLHELMSRDPRFASTNRYEAYNPSSFLGTESWLAPLVEFFMLPRRVQEDEVAFLNLCQLSPYLDWCFPHSRQGFQRYLTFRDATPDEIATWTSSLTYFAKALTLKHRLPLILKSPPHTARVPLILAAFPDARFIHIRRDPYAVFVSTVRLLKAIKPVFGLQLGPVAIDEEAVLQTYATMYDAYFADRSLIPAGQLVEIAYEDLDRDPVGQLRTIYDGLSLGDFEAVRPAMESYLSSVAGYQKTRHRSLDPSTKARIASACSASFDAWGYPR